MDIYDERLNKRFRKKRRIRKKKKNKKDKFKNFKPHKKSELIFNIEYIYEDDEILGDKLKPYNYKWWKFYKK
jgi:hypothetical protein